ncbi:MAG TPA: hypothetical protein VFP41_10475 [Actinomycetota bacterium]|nr:hypothetical protein [Actinomycetota bacterium]
MQRKWARSALIVALTSAVVFPIGSTNAVERTGRVLSYRCELIATTLGEQITLALRLRTNAPHRSWRIRMFHQGERVLLKTRRTNASGRLIVVRVVPNLRGRDEVAARARHVASGKACRVQTRI